MSGRQAEAGRVVRSYLQSLLDPHAAGTGPATGQVAGHDPDLAQDAFVRLVARAKAPGGTAWAAGLLQRTDAELGRLLARLVRHAAAEQSPERAYFRALRLHVEELVQEPGKLPVHPVDPVRLQVDGRIRRPSVEHALALLLEAEGGAAALMRLPLLGPRGRSRAVSQLTRLLTQRYPPEGAVSRGAPGNDGAGAVDPVTRVTDPARDGHARELEFWRLRLAPRSAAEIATLLGDDLAIVLDQLRGATLDDIARARQIPRSTVADRIKRAVKTLHDEQLSLGSYGTVAAALRFLLSSGSVAELDGAASSEARELQSFLEEGARDVANGWGLRQPRG